MKADALFWLLFGATAATYGLLLLVAGPEFQRLAGGGTIFDLRVTGYDLQAAREFFLAASAADPVSDEPLATSFYFNVIKPMDTVFPVLFGSVMAWSLITRAPGAWRLLAVVAIVHMMLDLAENRAIAAMFRAAPDLTAEMVQKASTLTVLKFLTVLPALLPALWFLFRPARAA